MAGNGKFFRSCRAGVMALLAACVLEGILSGPGAWAQAPRGSDAARYTVFMTARTPVASNRPKLQELLKAEGYAPHAEGETEVAVVLTAEEIRKLFQASVRFRSIEASASRGAIRQPYLENVAVPQRLRGLIGKVYLDPQRS